MKLTLKNFKKYEDFSIEFPTQGLVLLKGETGYGKTTIFEAIYDAITGDASNVAPWSGDKPVSISLDLGFISIFRSHYPESLHVVTDDGEFDGDDAQQKIYDCFTAHTSEFTAAYYIRQRMEGSLLSFGPADMLRFIQKLAFGDQDPEFYKKKIQERITSLSANVSITEASYNTAQINVNKLQSKLNEKRNSIPKPPSPPMTKEELQSVITGQKKLNDELPKITQQITQIQQLIKHPVHQARTIVDSLEDKCNILQEQNGPKITEITEFLRTYDKNSAERVNNNSNIQILGQKIEYIKWKQSVDQLSNKLKNRFPDFKPPASAFLSMRVESLTSNKNQIQEQIYAQKNELAECERSENNQPCPDCGTQLKISGGKIVKSESGQKTTNRIKKSQIEKHITELQSNIASIDKELGEFLTYATQVEHLKTQAIKDPLPDIVTKEDLEFYTEKVKSDQRTLNMEDALYDTKKDELKNIQKVMKSAQTSLDEAKTSTLSYSDIPLIENLVSQEQELKSKRAEITEQLSKIVEIVSVYRQFESQMEVFKILQREVSDLEAEVSAALEHTKQLKENLDLEKSLWAGAVRLKEISDAAAIGATEGIIRAINSYAENHLKELFPHGGTSIKILSGTKTNKGEDRSKLALQVVHKGQPVGKNINDLSGGEKDRIKVAFQLALAEIYNAKFLMLDEPFAGIDVENTMDVCLSLLKRFASDRLVIMAQHGAPEGLCDLVLEF